jgi:hypothetical protein
MEKFMSDLPPQPQVQFVANVRGELRPSIGRLVFDDDGIAYAVPPESIGCRFVVRLEKDTLELKYGALGLPYFVHHGRPVPA